MCGEHEKYFEENSNGIFFKSRVEIIPAGKRFYVGNMRTEEHFDDTCAPFMNLDARLSTIIIVITNYTFFYAQYDLTVCLLPWDANNRMLE